MTELLDYMNWIDADLFFVVTDFENSDRALSSSLASVSSKFSLARHWVVGTCGALVLVAGVTFALGKGLGKSWHEHFAFVVVVYSIASLMMNMINKIVVTILPPMTLVIIQFLIADIVLLCVYGPCTLVGEIWEKVNQAWRWCVVAVLFTSMLVTSLQALELGTLSTLLVGRNLLPLIMLMFERVFLPDTAAPVTLELFGTLAAIFFSTLMYTMGDFQGIGAAMLMVLLNVFFSCLDRLTQKSLLVDPNFKLSFGAISLVNNSVTILPLLVLTWLKSELALWPTAFGRMFSDWEKVACVVISGCIGLCLGWTSLAVQKAITATSFFVLQTCVKFGIVILAMWLLNDSFNFVSGTGCFLSLAAGAWYVQAVKRAWASVEKPDKPKPSQDSTDQERKEPTEILDVEEVPEDEAVEMALVQTTPKATTVGKGFLSV